MDLLCHLIGFPALLCQIGLIIRLIAVFFLVFRFIDNGECVYHISSDFPLSVKESRVVGKHLFHGHAL